MWACKILFGPTAVFCTFNLRLAGIYLLKVNIKKTRLRYEIGSKLTIKTPERRQWRRAGVFIVNFEPISHFVQVFLFFAFNM